MVRALMAGRRWGAKLSFPRIYWKKKKGWGVLTRELSREKGCGVHEAGLAAHDDLRAHKHEVRQGPKGETKHPKNGFGKGSVSRHGFFLEVKEEVKEVKEKRRKKEVKGGGGRGGRRRSEGEVKKK